MERVKKSTSPKDKPTDKYNTVLTTFGCLFSDTRLVDKCANCDVNADCVQGRCRCRKGYIGTGYVCIEGEI